MINIISSSLLTAKFRKLIHISSTITWLRIKTNAIIISKFFVFVNFVSLSTSGFISVISISPYPTRFFIKKKVNFCSLVYRNARYGLRNLWSADERARGIASFTHEGVPTRLLNVLKCLFDRGTNYACVKLEKINKFRETTRVTTTSTAISVLASVATLGNNVTPYSGFGATDFGRRFTELEIKRFFFFYDAQKTIFNPVVLSPAR